MKSQFFSREFLSQLPEDTDEAIVRVADEYRRMLSNLGASHDFDHDFLEVYAILDAFIASRELTFRLPPAAPPNINRQGVLAEFQNAKSAAEKRIYQRDSKAHFESKSAEYRALFSKRPVYEFSDGEFARLQILISEIRSEIQKAVLITDDHKRRLLRRLEAMQAELHKKTSDIDRFWGFIAEAGIVARKFGEDLKPLNDRVVELGRIVTAVIMTKEGIQALPEIAKILQLK